MSLDSMTLYFVAAMVAALVGVMMLLVGKLEGWPPLTWSGTAYLLGAASIGLWMFASERFGPTLSAAAIAIGFVACGMVWNAARVFYRRDPHWPGLVLGPLAWLAAVVTIHPAAVALRVTIGAAIASIYVVLTTRQLWGGSRKRLNHEWLAFVAPVLHGCGLLLPVLIGGLLSSNDADFPASIWVTVFLLQLVLYAVATVFIIFMLIYRTHKLAAATDPLTGMLNRRGFAEASARVVEREANAGRPVTAMIFDIDHFKSINDRFGHPAGDEVLKLFAVVVISSLRMSDLSGRIGGEEFAALLPCSLEEGLLVAERVRAAFAGSGIVVEQGPVDTTVSIGVAGGPASAGLDALLTAADAALYQAKRGGRNRVQATEQLDPSLDLQRRKSDGRSKVLSNPQSAIA